MRGVKDYYGVLRFFHSSTQDKKSNLEWLYDPLLMKDCEAACNRVINAVESGERVMILGDYDVDGTCGVSLFYLFLRELGLDPEFYIPDRINEGYGISEKAIDVAEELGIKLIISIDCGITAFEKVEYAKKKGIEFIICDHHQPPERIPDALAVIDVLREDDTYPYKKLCGTGVAFKLAHAVSRKLGRPELAFQYLDLVAIATASDIVPITDENRILVTEGLKQLNEKPRTSIARLIELCRLDNRNLTTSNVVFMLAPRINAVGRMGDAKRAVRLLISEDKSEIDEYADVLNGVNEERREIDKSITDTAFRMFEEEEVELEKEEGSSIRNSIIIYNETWHPGVVGIVAARLVEKYNKPSIVLTNVKGVAKGSARSISSFNIYEALKQCNDSLIQFGGHYHAAGLELEVDKIDEFKKQFNEIASKEITCDLTVQEIEYDACITLQDLSDKAIKILSYFEPYGPENMAPVFVTENVRIVGEVVKREKANTRIFRVMDPDTSRFFECVFFNSEEYADEIISGRYCDICYSVDRNVWKGRDYIKLRIRDIRTYTSG